MKILVLNCGSSSVKYKLIDSESKEVLAEGGVEKIGLPDSFLKFKRKDGSKEVITTEMPTAKEAVKNVLHLLTDPKEGVIKSFDEIGAVGHRVVHGMEWFNKSVLITPEVIEKVKECYPVAPLHNPANVTGIEAVTSILPDVPQVAVFDTAFHQTMPAKAYMYALPYAAYENMECVVMVSMARAIATSRPVPANSLAFPTTSSVSSHAISATEPASPP